MKSKHIIIICLILLVLPAIIGLFLRKDQIASKTVVINQPYYQVMADITNYFECNTWRLNVDTMYMTGQVDGYETWIEKYNNGDSVLVKVLKLGENDLITSVFDQDGHERMRNFIFKDIDGERTAFKMVEEVIITNPYLRFVALFYPFYNKNVNLYTKYLIEKYKNQPPAAF